MKVAVLEKEPVAIWLYHINPESPHEYSYEWDIKRPRTLLRRRHWEWAAGNMYQKVAVDDLVCAYMKNIPPNPNGIYVVGRVERVNIAERTLCWRPDQALSARILESPIRPEVIRDFFGRGYGGSMERLPTTKEREWLRLLGHGEVTEGIPLVKAQGQPTVQTLPAVDPRVSRKNGLKGELHVIKILRARYPKDKGFEKVHTSTIDPDADHDISIRRGRRVVRLVEVKTRMGAPGDPVLISQRQIARRRRNRLLHSIFIVYVTNARSIHSVVEIGERDDFVLKPRQFRLVPGLGPPGTNRASISALQRLAGTRSRSLRESRRSVRTSGPGRRNHSMV